MVWQDIVITICIVLSSYALIPQVIYGFKTKKKLIAIQTSLITTLSVYTITFVFFTLKLYFSTAINFLIGTLWLIILFQGIKYQ